MLWERPSTNSNQQNWSQTNETRNRSGNPSLRRHPRGGRDTLGGAGMKLITADKLSPDEVYFPHGMIEMQGESPYNDGRVYIDIGRRTEEESVPDEAEAWRLANLFLAAEDLLAMLKRIFEDSYAIYGDSGEDYITDVEALIAKAEGQAS